MSENGKKHFYWHYSRCLLNERLAPRKMLGLCQYIYRIIHGTSMLCFNLRWGSFEKLMVELARQSEEMQLRL